MMQVNQNKKQNGQIDQILYENFTFLGNKAIAYSL